LNSRTLRRSAQVYSAMRSSGCFSATENRFPPSTIDVVEVPLCEPVTLQDVWLAQGYSTTRTSTKRSPNWATRPFSTSSEL
jgi:hypothetical protein